MDIERGLPQSPLFLCNFNRTALFMIYLFIIAFANLFAFHIKNDTIGWVNKMKKRIVYMDLMRILAIFGVIMIHVNGEGTWLMTKVSKLWLEKNFLGALVQSWPVPLFIAISGALLLENKNFTFKTMVTKYIPRIIVPLIIWHTIYHFYTYQSFTLDNIVFCFNRLIIGKTYSHLWYLYLLLGLYLITPVLKKMVQNLNKKELTYLLVLGFSITSLIPFINNFLSLDIMKFIKPYKVLDFNIFVLYYILGYYINKYIFINKRSLLIAISTFSLASLVGLAILNNYLTIKRGVFTNYSGTSSIIAVIMVSFIFILFKQLNIKKHQNIIEKLGSLTFGVYLVHFLIEKELLKLLNGSFIIINSYIGTIVVSVIILILSYIVSYIISKISIIKKTIGL